MPTAIQYTQFQFPKRQGWDALIEIRLNVKSNRPLLGMTTGAGMQGVWMSGRTYNLYDRVWYLGILYYCRVSTTTGTPNATSDWAVFLNFDYIQPDQTKVMILGGTNLEYDVGTTYALNEIVYDSDGLQWTSLANGNAGNTPSLGSAWWVQTSAQFFSMQGEGMGPIRKDITRQEGQLTPDVRDVVMVDYQNWNGMSATGIVDGENLLTTSDPNTEDPGFGQNYSSLVQRMMPDPIATYTIFFAHVINLTNGQTLTGYLDDTGTPFTFAGRGNWNNAYGPVAKWDVFYFGGDFWTPGKSATLSTLATFAPGVPSMGYQGGEDESYWIKARGIYFIGDIKAQNNSYQHAAVYAYGTANTAVAQTVEWTAESIVNRSSSFKIRDILPIITYSPISGTHGNSSGNGVFIDATANAFTAAMVGQAIRIVGFGYFVIAEYTDNHTVTLTDAANVSGTPLEWQLGDLRGPYQIVGGYIPIDGAKFTVIPNDIPTIVPQGKDLEIIINSVGATGTHGVAGPQSGVGFTFTDATFNAFTASMPPSFITIDNEIYIIENWISSSQIEVIGTSPNTSGLSWTIHKNTFNSTAQLTTCCASINDGLHHITLAHFVWIICRVCGFTFHENDILTSLTCWSDYSTQSGYTSSVGPFLSRLISLNDDENSNFAQAIGIIYEWFVGSDPRCYLNAAQITTPAGFDWNAPLSDPLKQAQLQLGCYARVQFDQVNHTGHFALVDRSIPLTTPIPSNWKRGKNSQIAPRLVSAEHVEVNNAGDSDIECCPSERSGSLAKVIQYRAKKLAKLNQAAADASDPILNSGGEIGAQGTYWQTFTGGYPSCISPRHIYLTDVTITANSDIFPNGVAAQHGFTITSPSLEITKLLCVVPLLVVGAGPIYLASVTDVSLGSLNTDSSNQIETCILPNGLCGLVYAFDGRNTIRIAVNEVMKSVTIGANQKVLFGYTTGSQTSIDDTGWMFDVGITAASNIVTTSARLDKTDVFGNFFAGQQIVFPNIGVFTINSLDWNITHAGKTTMVLNSNMPYTATNIEARIGGPQIQGSNLMGSFLYHIPILNGIHRFPPAINLTDSLYATEFDGTPYGNPNGYDGNTFWRGPDATNFDSNSIWTVSRLEFTLSGLNGTMSIASGVGTLTDTTANFPPGLIGFPLQVITGGSPINFIITGVSSPTVLEIAPGTPNDAKTITVTSSGLQWALGPPDDFHGNAIWTYAQFYAAQEIGNFTQATYEFVGTLDDNGTFAGYDLLNIYQEFLLGQYQTLVLQGLELDEFKGTVICKFLGQNPIYQMPYSSIALPVWPKGQNESSGAAGGGIGGAGGGGTPSPGGGASGMTWAANAQTIALSTTVSNDNLSVSLGTNINLSATSAVPEIITGFVSTGIRTSFTLFNNTGYPVTYANQAVSLAGNRIYTGTGGNFVSPSGQNVTFAYDPSILLFKIVAYSSGNGIIIGTAMISANSDSPSFPVCDILRVSLTAAWELLGMAAGYDGQKIIIENIGTFSLQVMNNASATPGNNFLHPTMPNGVGGNFPIVPNASATYRYNLAKLAWLLETSSR